MGRFRGTRRNRNGAPAAVPSWLREPHCPCREIARAPDGSTAEQEIHPTDVEVLDVRPPVVASNSSASATKAALLVRLCRSSQQRSSSPGGRSAAAVARGGPPQRWREEVRPGQFGTWCRKLARDASPSAPSSARAGARTLASTTITILPKDRCGCRDRYPSTCPAARAVEHLFHGRDGGLLDQPAQQVLLPGRPRVAVVRPRTGRGCRRH